MKREFAIVKRAVHMYNIDTLGICQVNRDHRWFQGCIAEESSFDIY